MYMNSDKAPIDIDDAKNAYDRYIKARQTITIPNALLPDPQYVLEDLRNSATEFKPEQ